jgi:hypothetical protein
MSATSSGGTVTDTPADINALTFAGIRSLRQNDPGAARRAFEQVIAAGRTDASTWLCLAYACQRMKDGPAALQAIDQVLALEPFNLWALIFKGDHLAGLGDNRAAASFYLAAVKAAPPANEMPADLRGAVDRARKTCDRYAADLETSIRARVSELTGSDGRASARFAQSLDVLFGRKAVFHQQPRYYYFPGLPEIQFFEREQFPWLERVEASTAEIKAELLDILKEESAFKPYVTGDPNRPHNEQKGMLNNPDWSAFYLWKDGEIVPENAARCPRTLQALEAVPLTRVKNRSPSILFSLLRPGAQIPPHTGLINTRLICHLPLVVPEGCTFRVGNETRAWVEGKAWLFDDTMEHEAWNRSRETRVILLFEVWRPEVTAEERALIGSMFDAIDTLSGEKPAWEI